MLASPLSRVLVKNHQVLLGAQGRRTVRQAPWRRRPAPSPNPMCVPFSGAMLLSWSFLQGRATETAPAFWVPEVTTGVTPGVARGASPPHPDPALRAAPRLPHPGSPSVRWDSPPQLPHRLPSGGTASTPGTLAERSHLCKEWRCQAVRPRAAPAAPPCRPTCTLALADVAP